MDHALSLPAGALPRFEEAVLPIAARTTVPGLDRRSRAIRERLHPESIQDRYLAAAQSRHVRVEPGRDGMAWLTAYLPAADAEACYDRLTALAGTVAGTGAGALTRSSANAVTTAATADTTLAQGRADALVGLLTTGVTDIGFGAGTRATVSVTVPVLTLMGLWEEPGHLNGHGPIDPDTARRLAGTATSWTRILTHPETGATLSVGRDRYTVPADLRRYLAVRDRTCRFPGCGHPARRSDIDHTDGWAASGGHTAHDNLAHLCRHHHRLKHGTGWTVRRLPGGVLEWTSPTGRIECTYPEEGAAA